LSTAQLLPLFSQAQLLPFPGSLSAKLRQGQMHDLLQGQPKCKEHLHLKGMLEAAMFFEFAKKNNNAVRLRPANTDLGLASARWRTSWRRIQRSLQLPLMTLRSIDHELFQARQRAGLVRPHFDLHCNTVRGIQYSAHHNSIALGLRSTMEKHFLIYRVAAYRELVFSQMREALATRGI
jgi:hypothetical protein